MSWGTPWLLARSGPVSRGQALPPRVVTNEAQDEPSPFNWTMASPQGLCLDKDGSLSIWTGLEFSRGELTSSVLWN